MKTYRTIFEPDENGWWIVTVPSVPAAVAQGKTLVTARKRAVDAIATCLGLTNAQADHVEIDVEVRLPPEIQKTLKTLAKHRARMEELRAAIHSESRAAARKLLDLGVGTRGAAELLGISHQRVSQLVAD